MEKAKRLLALDVFRGLVIALMVIVNNPGSWEFVYSPLRHSKWDGCTPTDLVFPFFLFIVGVAMWFSFKKYGHSLTKKSAIKIVQRTVLIFVIGFLLNSFPYYNVDFTHARIMGVLQRIGLAYGLASFIVLAIRFEYVKYVAACILLLYWGIFLFFGGSHPFGLEGSIISRFDVFVLGENHVPMYEGIHFDRTGLLSTIPSVANVLFGYMVGKLTENADRMLDAVKKLLGYGIIGAVVAQIWNLVLPINKPLWSSSYVLYSTGLAMVFLGLLLWAIDIKGYKKWIHPFLVFGMNPLFIYVLAGIWAKLLELIKIEIGSGETVSLKYWMYVKIFEPIAGNFNGSLLFAIHMGIVFWMVGWFLYHRRIFIKI
jgi:predicted acyltransferase